MTWQGSTRGKDISPAILAYSGRATDKILRNSEKAGLFLGGLWEANLIAACGIRKDRPTAQHCQPWRRRACHKAAAAKLIQEQ